MAPRAFAIQTYILLVCFSLCSCDKIYRGEQLSPKEFAHIKNLGLLDADEKIYQFYSNSGGVKGAGNFYSTKRIAHYWFYRNDKEISFAYYHDISRIDTAYLYQDLSIPYMTVTRKDGSWFRVFVGGEKPLVKAFFESSITHWKFSTSAKPSQ